MEEVLLIDDDVELCSMLARYLGKNGFRAKTAHRGDTGLLKVKQGQWAMILIDVMLPGKDGFEVLRLIRAQSPVNVLLLTAGGAEMDRLAALKGGADDYLPKPFDPKELLERARCSRTKLTAESSGGYVEFTFGLESFRTCNGSWILRWNTRNDRAIAGAS